jgi:hypothetical protein
MDWLTDCDGCIENECLILISKIKECMRFEQAKMGNTEA